MRIINHLRQALIDEDEDTVRADILRMPGEMRRKPWTVVRADQEISRILASNGDDTATPTMTGTAERRNFPPPGWYPPPQFPPPTAPPPAGPMPQPASYVAGPQHFGAMPPSQQAWQASAAQRPSPMWGLTTPAAVLAFPIGLLAVYFSAQVNQNLRTGDLAAAAKNAGLAKTWVAILLGLGTFSRSSTSARAATDGMGAAARTFRPQRPAREEVASRRIQHLLHDLPSISPVSIAQSASAFRYPAVSPKSSSPRRPEMPSVSLSRLRSRSSPVRTLAGVVPPGRSAISR